MCKQAIEPSVGLYDTPMSILAQHADADAECYGMSTLTKFIFSSTEGPYSFL